jgi:hypothetical protein
MLNQRKHILNNLWISFAFVHCKDKSILEHVYMISAFNSTRKNNILSMSDPKELNMAPQVNQQKCS